MAPGAGDRTTLTVDEWLVRLRVEGERLGEVAAATALDAAVPGCPGWDVDALVRHMGDVHRWAGTIVRDRVQERVRLDSVGPDDRDGLLAWYRDGHRQLLDALSSATPDARFWAWGEAPSPLAFWARRQAHETAIHRLDVEQAAGLSQTPFPVRAATDGIDEWLLLAPARCRVTGGSGGSLSIAPSDVQDRWLVGLRTERITVERDGAQGECSVRAPASDLFALLMNRRGVDGIGVDGDAEVLQTWRESMRFV
ncbi:MAG: maleylpyruvate isomerase family mycothiol-dependent enzyme [Candidatus Dormibacteraeota bacterium]|nr:maleylpyruvate isomerase family mycothiol-dependent enzyme [Candidatus Dormibacteraeota bacterium]